MRHKFFLEIIAISCLLLTAIGGCTHQQNKGPAEPQEIAAQPDSGQYMQEISKQEPAVRSASDTSERMQAHLALAQLYTSSKNPRRDYKKALKHLEIYASLQPDFAGDKNLRNWLTVLKEMDRQSRIINQLNKDLNQSQQNIAALKKSAKKLKRDKAIFIKKNNQLTETNETLAKTIEMLKNIDRNIEEKRKTYTNQ
jgi:tetratricopeptide (TPR) repeat protein